MTKLMLIALGGAVGTVCRYGLHEAGVAIFGRTMSVGVLIANVVGCFALGFVGTLAIERTTWLSDAWHLALTVGFLGGLTTFSTFAYDTIAHAHEGRTGHALANVALHVALGLGTAALGWWAAMRVAGAG